MLILQRPWKAQPLLDPVVDPSHPLAPFVVGLWVGGVPSRAARQTLVTSGLGRSFGRLGPGATFGAYASTGIVNLPNSAAFRLTGVDASIVCGATVGSLTTVTYATIWSVRDSSTMVANIALGLDEDDYTGGRFGISVAGVATIGTSGSANKNSTNVYGAQWGSSGRSLYVNGALDVSDATTSQVASSTIQPAIGNRQTGGRAFYVGQIHFVYLFNTNIGPEWQRQLANDPWQIFQPRRLYIPTAAAAGGAPSITALSAISITATSAQPRISYS